MIPRRRTHQDSTADGAVPRSLLMYIIVRFISMIPTLLGVGTLVFLSIRLVPGTVVDQMLAVEAADPAFAKEMTQKLNAYFGLDRPLYVQYLQWVARVAGGDLGTSFRTNQPVLEVIVSRLPVTIQLTVGAMLVALAIGIATGVLSATRENAPVDHLVRIVSLLGLSIPIFWQAAMMILVLSVWFKWTPPIGYVDPITDFGTNVRVMLMPCIVLGTAVAANIMRMTRSSMLNVMRQDYIRTARAKGLLERAVIRTHGLKNALIPIITIAGLQMGYLLGGAVVTEEVFTLPGLGRLVLGAVYQRDYPVVQGTVLFMSTMFIMTNLVVDVVYAYVNPQIRYD